MEKCDILLVVILVFLKQERKMKRFTKFSILLLALLLIFLASSCSLFIKNDFKFVNNSTYGLSIKPNGQDWNSFYLSSGSSHTVSIWEDTIYFTYDHATSVVCDTSQENRIIFYNSYN